MLGLGLFATAGGEVLSSVLYSSGDAPVPSPADPVMLSFYPLVYVSLVLLLRARLRRLPLAVWLDGLTVGLAFAASCAAVAFGPISANTGGSTAAVVVGLAYPLGDLILLFVTAAALTVLGWRTERRWLLLAGGFLLYAVVDTIYLFESASGAYEQGTWIDSLWPAAVLLVARAAWLPGRRLADRQLGNGAVLVPPLACMAAAIAVLVADHDVHLPRLAVLLAAATLVAVAARLTVAFREVSALADSRRLAVTDELTGVANRRALVGALHEVGREAAAGASTGCGLLLIDLDRFKEINDTLGHHVGDELLRQLSPAAGARGAAPGTCWPGWAATSSPSCCPRRRPAGARAVAARLVDALEAPFALDGMTLHVAASVGIALLPRARHRPDAAAAARRRRDVPRQGGPRHGAAVYAVQDDAARPGAGCRPSSEMRAALEQRPARAALPAQGRACATGGVHGVEALVRWEHPARGLSDPDGVPAARRADRADAAR